MEPLIRYVLGELKMIARAPAVFAAALLILAGGIWWALDWRYSGIIANRDAEISSLKTQRDEYRDRLNGASPDQAAQKIKDLTDQLAFLQKIEDERAAKEWPPLTDKQITKWSLALAQYHPSFLAVFFTDQYSDKFRDSLYEVFRNASWPNPNVLNAGNLSGVKVLAAENDPIGVAFFGLLNDLTTVQKAYQNEIPPVPGKLQIYIGRLH